MKRHRASRMLVALLISLLPVSAHAADADSGSDEAPASVDQMDLEAVGERIRQTGAQMQDDLKKARARLEARKARKEEERRREAELARQQEIKEEAQRAALKERRDQEAAQRQAEASRKAAMAAQRAKEEQAAKARAARALQDALKSDGVAAFVEE